MNRSISVSETLYDYEVLISPFILLRYGLVNRILALVDFPENEGQEWKQQ